MPSSSREMAICCKLTWVISSAENAIVSAGMIVPRVPDPTWYFRFNRIAEMPVARYVKDRRKTELFIRSDRVPKTLATKAVAQINASPMYGVW